jgi:RHS repeat-associated protein
VLTDGYGEIYEHLEFFAFGETWVGERATSNSTPYLWSSKELDETALYYIHARYFDPRTSVWQSVDPAFGRGEYFPTMPTDEEEIAEFRKHPFGYWQDKLPGMGGVFNSPNLGVYTYAHQNPVKLTDPDGNNPTLYRILTHPATQRAYQYAERIVRGAYIAVTNASYAIGEFLAGVIGAGSAGAGNLSKEVKVSEQTGKIIANTLKEFKQMINNLSKPGTKLTQGELNQLRELSKKFGGEVRVDLKGVKGTGVDPHAHVEGLGSKVESRHIWLEEGVQ